MLGEEEGRGRPGHAQTHAHALVHVLRAHKHKKELETVSWLIRELLENYIIIFKRMFKKQIHGDAERSQKHIVN